MSWSFIPNFNQLINAGEKIYIIFHLSNQRWFNCSNQYAGKVTGVRGRFALFQQAKTIAALATDFAVYAAVLPSPNWNWLGTPIQERGAIWHRTETSDRFVRDL